MTAVGTGDCGLVATNKSQASAILTAVAALAVAEPACAERLEGMLAEPQEYVQRPPLSFE
jgi:hypothetical protein